MAENVICTWMSLRRRSINTPFRMGADDPMAMSLNVPFWCMEMKDRRVLIEEAIFVTHLTQPRSRQVFLPEPATVTDVSLAGVTVTTDHGEVAEVSWSRS